MQQEKPHNFKVAIIWFNITVIYFLPAFFAYMAKYCCFKFALTIVHVLWKYHILPSTSKPICWICLIIYELFELEAHPIKYIDYRSLFQISWESSKSVNCWRARTFRGHRYYAGCMQLLPFTFRIPSFSIVDNDIQVNSQLLVWILFPFHVGINPARCWMSRSVNNISEVVNVIYRKPESGLTWDSYMAEMAEFLTVWLL